MVPANAGSRSSNLSALSLDAFNWYPRNMFPENHRTPLYLIQADRASTQTFTSALFFTIVGIAIISGYPESKRFDWMFSYTWNWN
jgi:hypothetical protein